MSLPAPAHDCVDLNGRSFDSQAWGVEALQCVAGYMKSARSRARRAVVTWIFPAGLSRCYPLVSGKTSQGELLDLQSFGNACGVLGALFTQLIFERL